jgi:hypothetical protein
MYEDKPLLFNFLKNGTKYFYLNEFTFMRRLHNESVTGKGDLVISPWKMNSFYPVHFDYVYNDLMLIEKMAFKYEYYVNCMVFRLKFKKSNVFQRIASKLLQLPAIAINSLAEKNIINKYSSK